MTPVAYRNMLIKMGTEHGFQVFQTNEPNILLKPENVFMARIGAYVSEEGKKRFRWMRFNLDLSLQEQWR
jgi:acetoin utilization protein AcuA